MGGIGDQIFQYSYANYLKNRLWNGSQKTEKLYGLNLLLIKLEKLGILENYIQGNLQDFFCIMEHTKDENVIYRVLSCLFQMNNEIDNLLSQEHITKLKTLKDSTKPKNKFKIIDILDKYN